MSEANPSRTNSASERNVFGPLKRAWTRDLGGVIIGPALVHQGTILVTVGQSRADEGAERELVALDPAGGGVRWRVRLPDAPVGSHTAAGDGIVAFGGDGGVVALNVVDGSVRWSRRLTEHLLGPRVAVLDGVVYAGAYAGDLTRVVALSAQDGSEAWTTDTHPSGQFAFDNERVYLAGGCGDAVALSRQTGSVVWRAQGEAVTCHPGEVALQDGALYAARGFVWDASSGALLRRLDSWGEVPYAVSGQLGFYTGGGNVLAEDLVSGNARWRRETPEYTPYWPLVVGGAVYVASRALSAKGELQSYEVSTGRRLWKAKFPRPKRDLQAADGGILSAGGGRLLATAGPQLTAFRNVLNPSPSGVAIGADAFDVLIGKGVGIGGAVGPERTALRPRITLLHDRFPFGGYRAAAKRRAFEDGSTYLATKPRRNTRYRLKIAGDRSRPMTVFAYPKFAFDFKALSPRIALAQITLKGASRKAVSGERGFLYIDRGGSGGTLRRIGGGRTRGRTLAVRFERLARFGPADTLLACVPSLPAHGYGRRDAFSRQCGKRQMRVRLKAALPLCEWCRVDAFRPSQARAVRTGLGGRH